MSNIRGSHFTLTLLEAVGGSPRVESTETDNSKMYVQRHRWNGVGGLNSNFLCMSCLKFSRLGWSV